MLESELKFYLKTNLNKPSIHFRWTDDDNKKLLEHLNIHCDGESLTDEKNKFKIKQAFKEHFEDIGYILFKMSECKIRIKVFPYKIEPKNSVNLAAVIAILDSNADLIEYDYKGKENQISIPKIVKDQVYHFISKINNEEVNRKELARYAVSQNFGLRDHDIVIVKHDQIFIKILDDKYKKEDEKRFNGIKEEELKSLYNDFFNKQENKKFFFYIAKLFVQIHLLDEKINNLTYETKVFSFIQDIIVEHMSTTYTDDEDFNKGFAGYIFRIHFQEVFGYIADLILVEIAASNAYMIYFLKYYSSKIIVLDGKKYKVPELETKGGLNWNVVSMLSIVKIYVKAKTALDACRNDIDEINQEIKKLYIDNKSPFEYQKYLEQEIKKLTEELSKDSKKLEITRDSLSVSKIDVKKTILEDEITQLQEEMKSKRDEKTRLREKYISRDIINQYTVLQRKLDSTVRQINKEEKLLEQNKSAYLSIKGALSKALVSKKKLIG